MRAIRTLRDLRSEEDGTILVFFGLSLAVFMGIIALSFDLGRIGITQTELQSYADHVALAAAGELDGRPDSITRARAAAANLIEDYKTFGSGDSTLKGDPDYTLFFYKTLPNNDWDPMTGAITDEVKDAAEAAFVRAQTNASTVDMTFAAAFSALSGQDGPQNTVSASAVAGFTMFACDITPLMFCLPSSDYRADEHVGEMILLRAGGGQNAQWGPGDFGFLDPDDVEFDEAGPCAGLSGSKLDSCMIGAVGGISKCFAQRGVDMEPGQKVGIKDAIFNVRFDMYHATMNGNANDPAYGPAPNVIKGIVPKGYNGSGNACIKNSIEVSPDTVGLPRDDCFTTGSCGIDQRFGDGDWSAGRAAYVAANYDGVDPHPGADTRYEYYKAEITAAGGAGSVASILSGRMETGRPMCSPNQVNDPDRRLVTAAAIDCARYGIKGSARNVPVEEFFKIFLTEPVGDDGTNSKPKLAIFGEVVGSAGGDGSGGGKTEGPFFHDVVQLYR